MKLILKIGGSTLYKGDEIRIGHIKIWVNLISSLIQGGHRVGVVVGGGKPARKFSAAAKELGASNSYQDLLGIEAARNNARLFIAGLPGAYPDPPTTYRDLVQANAVHDLIIVGGFQPGQSTNAVAALFAEHMGADFLFNISDIDQVHDKDPQEHPDAIPYTEMNYETFSSIISNNEQLPGSYELFDRIGVDIVTRSSIPLVFVNGNFPQYVKDVLNGESRGTIIK